MSTAVGIAVTTGLSVGTADAGPLQPLVAERSWAALPGDIRWSSGARHT